MALPITGSVEKNVPPFPLDLPDGRILLCVVDTGFPGELALPADILASLDTQPVERRLLRAPDGAVVERVVYETIVFWDGAPRSVEVFVTDGPPLIGTLLLSGMRLTIDIRGDGLVLSTLVSKLKDAS